MKKIAYIFLIILLALSLAACGGSTGGAGSGGFELALVTDLGTIDDKSFNQGSWEGLVLYAEENNITHKYYQPTEQSDDAYLTAIDLAVKGGAKVVVTPGYLFEVPIYIAQDRYPETYFILIDGAPHDKDYTDFTINENVVGINYAEDQAGFLAGYAAVKDGYLKLGFVGGMAVPAVVRFGYGFIQGAEFAGKELGLGAGDLEVKYHYTGDFVASPEAQALAASWYNDGTEVIFACGGAVGNSVMAAAEQGGKKVIGVDVDQSSESKTVITSAMKGLTPSVYAALTAYYSGHFPGSQVQVFEAKNAGVGLPQDFSRFNSFNQAEYDAIYAKLANDEIPRMMDQADGNPSVVPVTLAVVSYFN